MKQADARLKLSEANTRRINSLRIKGLSNEQEEDQAISELGVNKASQVLARTRLKKMAIHAPFDGAVGLQHFRRRLPFVAPLDSSPDPALSRG